MKLCEEAPRYVSADRSIRFQPTRRVLSRIAKEGRTHGISLGWLNATDAKGIVDKDVDIEKIARGRGLLDPWETLEK